MSADPHVHSLFHLDGEINDLRYEPGDDNAAQPLHLEDE